MTVTSEYLAKTMEKGSLSFKDGKLSYKVDDANKFKDGDSYFLLAEKGFLDFLKGKEFLRTKVEGVSNQPYVELDVLCKNPSDSGDYRNCFHLKHRNFIYDRLNNTKNEDSSFVIIAKNDASKALLKEYYSLLSKSLASAN